MYVAYKLCDLQQFKRKQNRRMKKKMLSSLKKKKNCEKIQTYLLCGKHNWFFFVIILILNI